MKRSWKWAMTAGSLVALCGAFITGRSWADGIPATGALTYSGRLEAPNGTPLTGMHNVEVKFYDAEMDGTALCSSGSQLVTLEQGRFSVDLQDECTDAVRANPDVWVEILVDGSSLGRAKAGAVPYAVEAGHATTADTAGSADTLGTLTPADIQQRVSGTCPSANQFIRTINANGSVTCEADDNTTYTFGSGFSVSGTNINADTTFLQRRNEQLSTACVPGQSIRSISSTGAVACEPDDNTTYTADLGLNLSAGTLSINAPLMTSRSTPGVTTVTGRRFCALSGDAINNECDTTYNGSGSWTLSYLSGGGVCRWHCIPE